MNAEEIQVGLVQINNSFSGHSYFPYSTGLLQSYVQANAPRPQRYTFAMPVYARISVPEAVAQLQHCDIVGFSVYVWNIKLSLAIARALKAAKPEILIVFGGPQVPDQAEAFVREAPFIDLCCHGEGEQLFLDILETLPSRDWQHLQGVSYLDDSRFVHQPKGARIKDINILPSPYLSGVFDGLIQAHPETQWLALWETNRGCPFSCTFCDWGSATQSKVYSFDLERLYGEVDWFAAHKIEFIFCCDANFGILKRDLDIVRHVANTKQATGYPQALSVQNTKNATERAYEVQSILAESGLNKGVTLSLQSVSPTTLKSIKRANISSASYQELQRRFTRDRIETYTDVILGLPGETYDSFIEGVGQIIEDGQHNRIQFNNLAILPNAEMGNPAYQAEYGMVSVETKIINLHGELLELGDDIQETQDLVIATNTLPPEDWVKVRTFSWMTALLHFDKLLQIPIILLHELGGLSYREILESFMQPSAEAYPVITEMRSLFENHARGIQQGGPEYAHHADWLNIWWPVDEFAFIKLTREDKLDAFYQEALKLLRDVCRAAGQPLETGILEQAIRLNQELVKRPFQSQDKTLDLDYNLWEIYKAALIGEVVPLAQQPTRYHIDRTSQIWTTWADWYREVVWYGNKKGAYLYTNQVIEPQLSGHY
ncbi:MAG: B12-binding domain-containing radical SAM protein [Candidatus Sericytochromatia bacterium]